MKTLNDILCECECDIRKFGEPFNNILGRRCLQLLPRFGGLTAKLILHIRLVQYIVQIDIISLHQLVLFRLD